MILIKRFIHVLGLRSSIQEEQHVYQTVQGMTRTAKKKLARERLQESLISGLRVVIDFSWSRSLLCEKVAFFYKYSNMIKQLVH